LLKTPSSFKKKTRSNLPCFMHGFFSKVFRQDGVLLDEPDSCAIKDLRQMGYLFYKYQLPPCAPKKIVRTGLFLTLRSRRVATVRHLR
jgi:hypothetical protein